MKTVLITGASRGIGAACAKEFSEKNYHVVLNYNTSEKEAEALKRATGAFLLKGDVGCASDVENMKETLLKNGIHIDCIVNNAGISGESLFTEITEEDWDNMFRVNTKGAFLITKAFLPQMIARNSGSIINVSSIWGEVGAACEVHYSASKSALIGMTKALAKELAPSNIRVNCVCPGYVATDMNRHLSLEDVLDITKEIPIGRVGEPSEIAKTIEFLASDSASYITGQIIGVNGGWNIS